jgi:hypothetical protein
VLSWDELERYLDNLRSALDQQDVDLIRRILVRLVSGYVTSENIVDWITIASETAESGKITKLCEIG